MSALETDLLCEQAYIDGAWVDADFGATFPVVDPATGAIIANVPRMGAVETRRAIEAASVPSPPGSTDCVAPGFTMSAGVEAHPEVIEKLRDVSVAARTIQRDQVPEDVVGAVVYFASSGSSFVTGQTIVIDGGQYFH